MRLTSLIPNEVLTPQANRPPPATTRVVAIRNAFPAKMALLLLSCDIALINEPSPGDVSSDGRSAVKLKDEAAEVGVEARATSRARVSAEDGAEAPTSRRGGGAEVLELDSATRESLLRPCRCLRTMKRGMATAALVPTNYLLVSRPSSEPN